MGLFRQPVILATYDKGKTPPEDTPPSDAAVAHLEQKAADEKTAAAAKESTELRSLGNELDRFYAVHADDDWSKFEVVRVKVTEPLRGFARLQAYLAAYAIAIMFSIAMLSMSSNSWWLMPVLLSFAIMLRFMNLGPGSTRKRHHYVKRACTVRLVRVEGIDYSLTSRHELFVPDSEWRKLIPFADFEPRHVAIARAIMKQTPVSSP